MTVITCIEDLRQLAERRVPRMFYDYADSGSWTEGTYRDNEQAFQRIKLRQRVAVNMDNRSTAVKMIGLDAKMPVAIAPVGLTGMQHADGEIHAARAEYRVTARLAHDCRSSVRGPFRSAGGSNGRCFLSNRETRSASPSPRRRGAAT